jgi:hypothetical protein
MNRANPSTDGGRLLVMQGDAGDLGAKYGMLILCNRRFCQPVWGADGQSSGVNCSR